MALFYRMALFFAGTVFLFAGLATAVKVLQLAGAIFMIFQAAATVSENMARCQELIRIIGSFLNRLRRYQEEITLRNHLRDGVMSWIARVQVLLGVARAIKHLHCLGVVHNNVTSSSILLDQSLAPRVSGFGASVRRALGVLSQAVGVVPTFWYADPETDVYSFGVVMLEVLTGIPVEATNTTTLVLWALPSIREGMLCDVLDRRPASVPTQRQWEALELVAETTVRCLEPHWDYWPAISDVVADLEEALNLIYNDL